MGKGSMVQLPVLLDRLSNNISTLPQKVVELGDCTKAHAQAFVVHVDYTIRKTMEKTSVASDASDEADNSNNCRRFPKPMSSNVSKASQTIGMIFDRAAVCAASLRSVTHELADQWTDRLPEELQEQLPEWHNTCMGFLHHGNDECSVVSMDSINCSTVCSSTTHERHGRNLRKKRGRTSLVPIQTSYSKGRKNSKWRNYTNDSKKEII